MTISTTDLKIYKAQRMRDTADGGGAMSPNLVVDGELNNVFDDVSSQDRTTGRVSIRKGFPGAYSANTDRYFGAGLVIVAPANDPDIDILMTHTGDFVDERSDVVERIESYLVRGGSMLWRLQNDHLQGTASLSLYAPRDAATPDIGETIFLENTSNSDDFEAVKVQEILSRASQTFFDGQGSFQRDVLSIQLTRPLQQDWTGTEVLRSMASTPPTRLRRATVAAGARYSGVKAAEDVTQGDTTIEVDSPFGRLVPSTTSEVALTDERASLAQVSFEKVGADNAISVSTGSQSFSGGETKSFYLGGTVYPGSVTVSGTVDGEDNGDGTLSFSGSQTLGTVDYETGEVAITRNTGGSISLTITATPGAAVQDSTLTTRISVTPQTRQLNYVRTLRPLPSPGTISVDYRALQNWYRLRDNGQGQLQGESPGQGGGSVNYGTGSVTATLAVLPDVGTDIILSWGTPVTVENLSGEISVEAPEITHAVSAGPIKPTTLAIEYMSDSSLIELEDDGEGLIVIKNTTTQVGRVVYSTGELAFRPADWPDSNATVQISYEQSAEQQDNFQPTPSGGNDVMAFDLVGTPVRPGSVRLSFPVEASIQGCRYQRTIEMTDDGVGGFVYTRNASGAVPNSTVNYSTGAVSVQGETQAQAQLPSYTVDDQVGLVFTGYSTGTVTARPLSGVTVQAWHQEDSAASSAQQDSIEMPAVQIDLVPWYSDGLVPGSIRFQLNGRTYVDRQGDLVTDPAVTTNAGSVAGTVDYSGGTVTITNWDDGNFVLDLVGAGLLSGVSPTDRVFFRTPAAPIAQASLTVQANRFDDGTLLQATANAQGEITASLISGSVNVENGIVDVRFGEYVTAAGNEDEWWYDESLVENGEIWKPTLILPGSAFFSCVALTSIPLDPQILGLDPIRLPSDGRVPIFRAGDTVVISQRNEVEDADPAAGAIVDLGINNVKWVRVKDANGAVVLSEHYTVDGPAGELQWANPLDLSAYTGPYTIEAMAYFMRLCNDVEINGTIHIASPAPFPLANADAPVFLSTKLIFTPDGGNQDLQALYTNLFTQSAWTGEWSDDPTAGSTTGQYDDANHPLELINSGGITERWRLEFVTTTTVNVIGERLGQIITGASINEDISPTNPATGQPYFTIKAAGWSGGWDVGNIVRFNTLGANYPVWMIRSTQPGDSDEELKDRFIAHLMGDVAKEDE